MRLVLILSVLSLAMPAQDPADEAWQLTLRLSRVKRHVRGALANQPDNTCLVTIDRYRWPVNQGAQRKTDTVRVEVAYVGGHELYSWPGDGRFSDKPLSQMVGVGMVGDGDFAVHAHNLFIADNGIETFRGEEIENGRKLWRWDYRISRYQSGWSIRHGDSQQIAGVEGSFWADAETLDLVKMDTHATDFVTGFPLKAVVSTVRYARMRIGEQDVLMPQQAELSTTTLEGAESRNHTEYSNCRQYAGQSTITFNALPEPETPTSAPARIPTVEARLPAGLTLKIQFASQVKLSQLSVGSAIAAVLAAPLRDGGKEIAPKGTAVRGRVRLLNRDHGEFVELGLEFDELEFAAHLDHFTASMRGFDTPGMGVHMTIAQTKTYTPAGDGLQIQKELGPSKLNGAGVFFLEVRGPGLPKGAIMTWVTQ